ALPNFLAGVHQTRDDLARDTEGQIRLHAGSDDSGVAALGRYGGRDLRDFDELRFGPRVLSGCGGFAARQTQGRRGDGNRKAEVHRKSYFINHEPHPPPMARNDWTAAWSVLARVSASWSCAARSCRSASSTSVSGMTPAAY